MSARRTDSGLDGILLIDKPSGWTSHDVVAKARGILGQRRIGHTGTLDPMATGLLVLCAGQATRLVEYLTGHDKRYTGVIRLGVTTATDDAEGELIAERPVPVLTPGLLEAALETFRGLLMQVPPAHSALKVDGKRAYQLARAGNAPEMAARPVTIRALTAALITRDSIRMDVTCSAGTYIRSLARDLGEALGCGAHLSALRRESAGMFRVEDAVSLEALERLAAAGELEEILLPIDEGVCDLNAALIEDEAARIITNGGWWATESGGAREAAVARIYSASGEFIGVGSVSSLGEIQPIKVLRRRKS